MRRADDESLRARVSWDVMPPVHRFAPLAALALAVLTGHVTDKTTSQPPSKVSVEDTVGKQTTKHDFIACSTTLDYSCGAGF